MISVVDIADAVTERVQAFEFGQDVVVRRRYVPTIDSEELQTLHVEVVPRPIEMQVESRSTLASQVVIDVGVQKHVSGDEECDLLLRLTESLLAHLADPAQRQVLEGVPLRSVVHDPIHDGDALQHERVFVSVLRLTYYRRS